MPDQNGGRIEHKTFILGLTQRVAETRKNGGFMGLSGERLSEAEREAIGEISGALAWGHFTLSE
jgi:hypothetical protein